MRPLVIVRPEPGASATARDAEAIGVAPVVMPLFEVRSVEWSVPDPGSFDGLLLTSANAVRHGGKALDGLRMLPAHCVGEATAASAREAGFTVATVGNGGVDALLESLPAGLKLLHLGSADRREPDNPRQSIEHLPVYEAIELPISDRFEEIEGAVVAVHSPRAGSVLARHVGDAGLSREKVAIAAISAAAAEAAGTGWDSVDIAAEPTDAALLAIAARLCNNPG